MIHLLNWEEKNPIFYTSLEEFQQLWLHVAIPGRSHAISVMVLPAK